MVRNWATVVERYAGSCGSVRRRLVDAWLLAVGITYGGYDDGDASWLLVVPRGYVFIIILYILPIFINSYAFFIILNSFLCYLFIKILVN